MVQVREHPRVGTFLVIVGAVAWGVAMILAGILSADDLRLSLRYLGTATATATVAYYLLHRYFWRWRMFRRALKIPDLSGRWEGWSYRSLTQEWLPSAHEISQQALDIGASAWGPNNWSRGLCASIVSDRHGVAFEFVWSYKTETVGPGGQPGDTHQGTHFHRLVERDGNKYLEGTYITDRIRSGDKTMGAGGFHRLVWVSNTFKNGLDYDEGKKWGMEKPKDNPIEGR